MIVSSQQYAMPSSKKVLFHSCDGVGGRSLYRKSATMKASSSSSSNSSFDEALLRIAQKAVEEEVKEGMVISLGSGSICSKVINVLEEKAIADCKYIPASILAAKELALHGLGPVVAAEDEPAVDVTFIQPNEIAVMENDGSLICIMDRESMPVQPSILGIQTVLSKTLRTILLSDSGFRDFCGGSVPIEIEHSNWQEICEELDDIFLGDAEIWRRASSGAEASHPSGGKNPYVSPDGNSTIIDIQFKDALNNGRRYKKGFVLDGEDCTPFQIKSEVEGVDGVLAHGLYCAASAAYVPTGDSGLQVLKLEKGGENDVVFS